MMPQEDYQSIVEQLIPAYSSEDFELVLSHVTDGQPASVRLLVKMELKRIMSPCSKAIDLRGRVRGECREYKLEGFTHWFDDVAINTYHKSINKYGSYTMGVWEELTHTRNNFKVLHQQEQLRGLQDLEEDYPFEVDLIRFGHYLTRSENRLQMATQVEITLPNHQEIHGISSDLSSTGAKFKVPSAFNYGLGQILRARFPRLAKDTDINELNDDFEYRILGVDDNEDNDSFKWLRLKLETETNVIHQAIDIKLNNARRRARHDNQDQILRARTRGYEHCFLKHSSNLPLFFSGNELKYALLTEHNQEQWHYWHDEKNQPMINHLFNKERMEGLTKPGLKISRSHIYSFNHEHEDKTHFYSMALTEATREERQLFWHLGARRASWKVSRLSMFELDGEDIERLLSVAPEMEHLLTSLTHIGILQEISVPETHRDFLLTEKPQLATKVLNNFKHPRNPICKAQALYFDPTPRRSEPRFNYETPIELHYPGHEGIIGKTIDFSTRGLNLLLAEPLPIKSNSDVRITFTELQKLDAAAPLTKMSYKVVRLSPSNQNIQLIANHEMDDHHRTEHFLRRLINHNLDKLHEDNEPLPSANLLKAMHQLLLGRLISTPYFVEKNNHRMMPRVIGVNFPLNTLQKLFQRLGHGRNFSVESIFKTRMQQLLTGPMRPVEVKKPFYHELYIAAQIKDGEISAVRSKMLNEFTSLNERISFITKAQEQGEFYAVRISGVPVHNPLTTLLGEELGELAQTTIHHARALEEEFTSLVGCGELYDITDEVLIRLELG